MRRTVQVYFIKQRVRRPCLHAIAGVHVVVVSVLCEREINALIEEIPGGALTFLREPYATSESDRGRRTH